MLPCLTLTCLSFHNLDFPKKKINNWEGTYCWWSSFVNLLVRPAPFTLCSFCAFILIEKKIENIQYFPGIDDFGDQLTGLSFKTPCYIHLFIDLSFFPTGNPWNQKPHVFFPMNFRSPSAFPAVSGDCGAATWHRLPRRRTPWTRTTRTAARCARRWRRAAGWGDGRRRWSPF